MKKYLTVLCLSMALFAMTATPILAATGLKGDARHIINRTIIVVAAARKAAKTGHQYAGLAKVIAHQKHAVLYFKEGSYLKAISHSLRARIIAVEQFFNSGKERDVSN